jgi:hypothetical protein
MLDCDWSSDVCSSDLAAPAHRGRHPVRGARPRCGHIIGVDDPRVRQRQRRARTRIAEQHERSERPRRPTGIHRVEGTASTAWCRGTLRRAHRRDAVTVYTGVPIGSPAAAVRSASTTTSLMAARYGTTSDTATAWYALSDAPNLVELAGDHAGTSRTRTAASQAVATRDCQLLRLQPAYVADVWLVRGASSPIGRAESRPDTTRTRHDDPRTRWPLAHANATRNSAP